MARRGVPAPGRGRPHTLARRLAGPPGKSSSCPTRARGRNLRRGDTGGNSSLSGPRWPGGVPAV